MNIEELTLERLGLVTEFSAIYGVSVLIQQTGSAIGLSLDQLIEAGEWAKKIKSGGKSLEIAKNALTRGHFVEPDASDAALIDPVHAETQEFIHIQRVKE